MMKDVNIQIALPPADRVAELTHTADHFSLTLLSVFSQNVIRQLAAGKNLFELFEEGLDVLDARSYIIFLQHEYVFSQTNWEKAPIAVIPVPSDMNPLELAQTMAEKAGNNDFEDFQNPIALVHPKTTDVKYVTVGTGDQFPIPEISTFDGETFNEQEEEKRLRTFQAIKDNGHAFPIEWLETKFNIRLRS